MAEPTMQVAANTRGVALLQGLVAEYGLDVISAYMGHIQVGFPMLLRLLLLALRVVLLIVVFLLV